MERVSEKTEEVDGGHVVQTDVVSEELMVEMFS